MTRLYLVRHGETKWNSEIRIQGHRDIPLSESGRCQARQLAQALKSTSIDAAYSSDLSRAMETAQILLEGRGLAADPRSELREAGFGEWEGLTYQEITLRYPDLQQARREKPAEVAPPGGELFPAILRRVRQIVDQIVVAHPERSVLIVSHGGPIRLLLGALLGLGIESYWKVRIDNCSLTTVDVYDAGSIVSLLNDTCHLSKQPADDQLP